MKLKRLEMLSKYMTLEEATRSRTASRNGIDNQPTKFHYENMRFVADNIFDKVREFVGSPVTCSSFYRSKQLNSLVGGSSTSFHTLGAAIDLRLLGGSKTYAEVFEYIRVNLKFSELIWEYGNDEEPDWVHVAYASGDERAKVKKVQKVNGENVWFRYDWDTCEWVKR